MTIDLITTIIKQNLRSYTLHDPFSMLQTVWGVTAVEKPTDSALFYCWSAIGDLPWCTALKALLFPGGPPGDPPDSWGRWWLAKSSEAESFRPCLEVSAPEGDMYSEGISRKKNVFLGSNWNRSAVKRKNKSIKWLFQRGPISKLVYVTMGVLLIQSNFSATATLRQNVLAVV